MICGFNGKFERGRLYILLKNVTMNAERYIPFFEGPFIANLWISWHQNFHAWWCPLSYDQKMYEFLQNINITPLGLTENNPDLNPPKMHMKVICRIRSRSLEWHHPNPNFTYEIKNVRSVGVSHDYLRIVAEGMLRRLATVIKAKGGMTKYQYTFNPFPTLLYFKN